MLKKLLYFLTPQERKFANFLLMMMFVMALLDMIGVVSILPFIAVLTNPEIIETNTILNKTFQVSKDIFDVQTKQQFLIFLGFCVFVLLIISLLFKACTIYLQLRFTHMRGYSLGKRLIESYLHQPYSWFLNRHSADLAKSILSEVETVVGNAIRPTLDLIANTMVVIILISSLIIVDPKLALISSLSIGVAYSLIYKITRGFLNRIGKERVKANEMRFTTVSEAFGASKEIKVGGLESSYINQFDEPAKTYAQHTASSQVIRLMPRFGLEIIAFGGLIITILSMMMKGSNFNNILPIITLYAFAGYRIIPAIQRIYASISQLRFVSPSVDALYNEFKNLKKYNLNYNKDFLNLNKSIKLNNISYKYPNSSKSILKNININIPARSTVGLVGATGSGKTTTVDIILSLLEANEGSLEVDGNIINKDNCRAWQNSIGYVPQQIYLADKSIAENVAFGIEPQFIDQRAVEHATKIANLHNFVINELPNQYQTKVGERGVRLSGGQRQRIGIARALYHNPKVLILDEATSALDNLTEKVVMEAVSKLGNEITIIMIAHRLSTVKECDMIFLLENGELKEQGTFERLTKTSDIFKLTTKNL